MDRSRLEISPGVWLDARRCIFLESERVLAVSDLHIGYAWAHRFGGQLLPLHPDGVRERLSELCASCQPKIIALLGDIVHQSVPVSEIKAEVVQLLECLRERCGVKLILGNHDKGLAKFLGSPGDFEFTDRFQSGENLLVHGNHPVDLGDAKRVIMGHEHPAISLGDGVRSAKFPCFLAGPKLIVLPAFSRWAAGSDIRSGKFMSSAAGAARFEKAVAIMNEKLLPVPLG